MTTPHAALGVPGAADRFSREMFVRGTGLRFDREWAHRLRAGEPARRSRLVGPLAIWPSAVTRCIGGPRVRWIPVLMPVTNVHGWNGGWSPAARFSSGVAASLVGRLHVRCPGGVGRRIVVTALVAVQLAIGALVLQFPKTLCNDGDGVSAFR